jgi:hypothetical protein
MGCESTHAESVVAHTVGSGQPCSSARHDTIQFGPDDEALQEALSSWYAAPVFADSQSAAM